ncbi:hypothetical protein AGRA3207_006492 [Actinomadura graeca]|uniref:Uncharacterized protein n=1 Tax=Actinomadura graeca TaxID=2750812 RepID=A0ABX8R1Z6_9ACTN|nr:hypothetical protein [Actinomadura graeca]QXJ25055.1 hypothetical protein AGRA3207_006492 [Actinomadura graeca]
MTESEVPIMCTLSPNNMVERLTRFESLFAEALTAVERKALSLRLTFDADAEKEAAIRDLFALEQQCCAFLTLTCTRTAAGLIVDVTVPRDAEPTLDGIQTLAGRNAPPEIVAQGWTG